MTTVAGIQRPLRGSRISTFYPVKSLPSLASLDSAFQLQEYISLLIRLDVHDVEAITSIPRSGSGFVDKEKEKEDGKEEEGDVDKDGEKKSEVAVDEACWVYEHLRRLAQDLSHPLITTLQQECTRATCPEMKAGEWLYLCVAHGNDGAMEQCCAIDYILHTVDSATALLNSPRTFPSRLQIPQTSHRHFSSLARRLGRIFAHAYFHHREAFEQAEAESSLYARFLALTSKFDLVPSEFLVIPSANPEDAVRDDTRYNQSHPQQYPQPPQVRSGLAPKFSQQQHLGLGSGGNTPNSIRARSPNPPGLSESGFGRTGFGTVRMAAGGIGEQPIPASMRASPGPSFNPLAGITGPIRDPNVNASNTGSGGRARFGRNRTDTMVLHDTPEDKAKPVDKAEEVPAKIVRPEPDVPSSEVDPSEKVESTPPPAPEPEISTPTPTPSSSEPTPEPEVTGDDDRAEEAEIASQFEVSFNAEDEIASPFDTEIGGIPVILDADIEEEEAEVQNIVEDISFSEENSLSEEKDEVAEPVEADVTDPPSPEEEAPSTSSKPDTSEEPRVREPVVTVTDFASETPVETVLSLSDESEEEDEEDEDEDDVEETPAEAEVPQSVKAEPEASTKPEDKASDVTEKSPDTSDTVGAEDKKASVSESSVPEKATSDS